MGERGRAWRRHQNKRVAKARRRFDNTVGGFFPAKSDNELATRHPYDCGGRCFMCHGEKLRGAYKKARRRKHNEIEVQDD